MSKALVNGCFEESFADQSSADDSKNPCGGWTDSCYNPAPCYKPAELKPYIEPEKTMPPIVVAAMYQFVTVDKPEVLREPLLAFMHDNGLHGTLLLAKEGINGTVAGSRESVDKLLNWLRDPERFPGLSHKESYCDEMPFLRSKVKLKKEIVTMGVEGVDPKNVVGSYVKPEEWNALIEDPEVVLVDTRNDYEVQIGSFRNAINPHTESFREFPAFVAANLDPARHKKVAMFCTGGIRCEKSTSYLKSQGFDEVYHLEGGILKYLETVPESESNWEGECFVFDERVAVDHQLNRGHYDQCNACRMPITEDDKKSEHYLHGVSCPHCHDKTSAEQRSRFAERQKQVELAKARGEQHIGGDVSDLNDRRKAQKLKKKETQKPG